jgi:hypothetical protein
LAQEGDFPVRIIRVGRSYLVAIPAILELLGIPVSPTAVISATVK